MMTSSVETDRDTSPTLRIWPVIALAGLSLWCWLGPTYLEQHDQIRFGTLALGAMLQTVLILVWCIGLSRINWKSRGLMLLYGISIVGLAVVFQHKSIGISILLFGIPSAILVLALVLLISRRMSWKSQCIAMALAWGTPLLLWDLVRSDGFKASFFPEVRPRWSTTSEQELLVSSETSAKENRNIEIEEEASDWPRFRGPRVDGKGSSLTTAPQRGNTIRDVWRKPAGPSWSSMIVVGKALFTFEQRGDSEALICLEAATGEFVWSHEYACRFEDSTQVSGAGPRGTPTFHDGKLYAVGGKGNVKVVDASSGKLIWERDLIKDAGGNVPQWGFSTSPLVVGDSCFIMPNSDGFGNSEADVVCYQSTDGSIKWKGSGLGATYSSPTIVTLSGVPQIVIAYSGKHNEVSGQQVVSRDPATGVELWRYSSDTSGMAMITPVVCDENALLIVDAAAGTTKLEILKEKDSDRWTVRKLWSQNKLLPEYSDLVVQNDLVFGLSKGVLTALHASDGKVAWKKLRFGGGQLIGIPSLSAVLVQGEEGQLQLLSINATGPSKIAEASGLKGKTWNHPIQVGNRFYARNAEEIACFELLETSEN